MGNDSTVWGRYRDHEDEVEIWEGTFEDEDEFQPTVVHASGHREFPLEPHSNILQFEQGCPPAA